MTKKIEQFIRNIAIIAHVDHGKTTFVDSLLKQSGLHRNLGSQAMDSNDLEKEKGITILSKCTSIQWKDYTLNIIDTPGHSDFGSEVERIMKMADGFILIVDAVESIMPQTRFVLECAIKNKLKPIVFVNKIDRPNANPKQVADEILDLMFSMDPEYIDTPVFFGSGLQGFAYQDLKTAEEKLISKEGNIDEILNTIVDYIPHPVVEDTDFKMLVSMAKHNPFFGKLLIGKITSGEAKCNDMIYAINTNGVKEKFKINKIFKFAGTSEYPVDHVFGGEIIAIAGCIDATVNDTLSAQSNIIPLTIPETSKLTMSVFFSANTSPLAGKSGGKKLTSKEIFDYLWKEASINIGISLESISSESLKVYFRGELQLSIIVEQMRRDGFEFTVSPPEIVYKVENGVTLEPIQEVIFEVDAQYISTVMEAMSFRNGVMIDMIEHGGDRSKLIYHIPTKNVLGYYYMFISQTKGTGLMFMNTIGYEKLTSMNRVRNGVLISMDAGTITSYALDKLSDRGTFFVKHGDQTYSGMIIGEHNRPVDLDVNPVKTKQLTNVRSAGKDDNIVLPPPRQMPFEVAITYIIKGEAVEVTPTSIRLRKWHLDPNVRKKIEKTELNR